MSVTKNLLAGRYLLEELIARGGMGEVWRARDEVLERPVAVKVLNDGLADDKVAAERFRREALTAAQISHPNMANVFDYIEESGRPGIVMELVPSETLGQRLIRGQLPISDAAAIADSVLAALEAAHAAGIVHRDIKPGNILLTPAGTVKVTDFGIARSLGDASLTQTGAVMGTAHYSAPEQVRGETATPSTDLYSVGVVLYEMLTGARPFAGDTPMTVALARLSDDPVSPRVRRREIPEALDAVVMRALARNPAKRFASATEMRNALALAAQATAPDATAALPVDAAETVALRPAVQEEPRETIIPPPWWGARIAKWLAPLILIALLAWGLVEWTSGPTTTTVPTFEGMTLSAAEDLGAKQRLTIKQGVLRYSSAKAGTVLDQSVEPGKNVKNGTLILLTVSRGPVPCCTVPDLAGMTEEQARAALEARNLQLGEITFVKTTSGEDGSIVSQDPTPGARINPGNSVNVSILQVEERKHGKHGGD